jgi:hypothetical protein
MVEKLNKMMYNHKSKLKLERRVLWRAGLAACAEVCRLALC